MKTVNMTDSDPMAPHKLDDDGRVEQRRRRRRNKAQVKAEFSIVAAAVLQFLCGPSLEAGRGAFWRDALSSLAADPTMRLYTILYDSFILLRLDFLSICKNAKFNHTVFSWRYC